MVIKLKVQWFDGEKSWENIEALKRHNPKKVFEYAIHKDLINTPGWEWINKFTEADKHLEHMREVYLASKDVAKFKFGVEVARSPIHALELDQQEGNNLWKEAIKGELDQINEYKTFRAMEDSEHIPTGYKKNPLSFCV